MATFDKTTNHYYIFPQDVLTLKDTKEGVYKTAIDNIVKLHNSVYKVNILKETKPEKHYGKKKGVLW